MSVTPDVDLTNAGRSGRRRSGRSTSFSAALKRAVRWRWLSTNPIVQAEPPPAPKPNPQPPTAQEAGRILAAAWVDPDWGTLVWLAVVTGVRRGELCGLQWRKVDLASGVLTLNRSIGQRNKQTWEKDTKTQSVTATWPTAWAFAHRFTSCGTIQRPS